MDNSRGTFFSHTNRYCRAVLCIEDLSVLKTVTLVLRVYRGLITSVIM